MINKKSCLVVGLFICTTPLFADSLEQENQIAEACKPYLQQYNPQQDPNTLPPEAQAALTACSAHGSCQTSILSSIPDCAIKLNALQPNQTPPLSVIQNNPAGTSTSPAKPVQNTNTWGLPSAAPTPGAAPQATDSDATPTSAPTDADADAAAPSITPPAPPAQPAPPTPPAPPTSTQPQNDQSTPAINWF